MAKARALPPRLDALTTLRFVAAAMVVTIHSANVFGPPLDNRAIYALNTAVSFFFVLSGFVLAYNYPRLDDPGATRGFLVMRFARIWPMHLFALVVLVAIVPRAGWLVPGIEPWSAAVLSVLLLQSWFPPIPGYAVAFNGPTWTISVDVFSYAAFPFLIARMRESPVRSLVGAILIAFACALAANALGPPSHPPLDQWNWYMLARFFPPARLGEFVLGMAAARFFVARRDRPPRGLAAGTLVELAALAATAAALAGMHHLPWLAGTLGPGVADWLAQVASAPVFAALIVVMSGGNGAVSRVLARRACVHLGDLAYATYLLHLPLLHLSAWAAIVAAAGAPAAAAAFWATLLGFAHLAWRFVELPARRAIVRRARSGFDDPALRTA